MGNVEVKNGKHVVQVPQREGANVGAQGGFNQVVWLYHIIDI